ncbi:I78 family peptidase inhibitor [Pseudooceanicola sp.]|uniref:I78 family peptidase inhibitor n=1 Tax=Pseudooceanicola sp. TaxID=1914328 RepID=UPI00260C2200|nr:I78 family peptidase inhibitor [Pseudooceanicola sp.]MDF1855172.1 I78 family peptidase inhibitor [Pseudooceanicola sp.]
MIRLAFAVLALALLSACKEEDDPMPNTDESALQDACGASGLQDIVGLKFDANLLPAGSGKVRVIHPDTMVTRDYRPDRLNIILDESEIVTDVRCG